jgi:hypothetical protein
MVGYQRFGGPCCLHLQGEVVFRHVGIHTTSLHGVTTQENST